MKSCKKTIQRGIDERVFEYNRVKSCPMNHNHSDDYKKERFETLKAINDEIIEHRKLLSMIEHLEDLSPSEGAMFMNIA